MTAFLLALSVFSFALHFLTFRRIGLPVSKDTKQVWFVTTGRRKTSSDSRANDRFVVTDRKIERIFRNLTGVEEEKAVALADRLNGRAFTHAPYSGTDETRQQIGAARDAKESERKELEDAAAELNLELASARGEI